MTAGEQRITAPLTKVGLLCPSLSKPLTGRIGGHINLDLPFNPMCGLDFPKLNKFSLCYKF